MKVGIIGSGDVGQRLAGGFVKSGHQVMIGTREPKREALVAFAKETNVKLGTDADAAKFGDVLVLATLWGGTQNAIKLAGGENFRGKVVIDVTNPLIFGKEDEPPMLALGHTDSGGEQVQRWLPGARVVKALNIVGNAVMVDPKAFHDPTMFIAGNDAAAKKQVDDVLRGWGWKEIVDLGGIEGARLLEPLCILWVAYGMKTGSWTHAFKAVRA